VAEAESEEGEVKEVTAGAGVVRMEVEKLLLLAIP